MAKRGAPKRKEGERHPNGRLKHTFTEDQGHDATLERRACMVGTARASDPRAGYPLGVLWMTDRITEAQHDAGLWYVVDHAILFGQGSPPSHLGNLIATARSKAPQHDDDSKFMTDTADRYGRKVAAVRTLPPPSNPFPFHVLERIAIDEEFQLTPPELDALKRALDALVAFRP